MSETRRMSQWPVEPARHTWLPDHTEVAPGETPHDAAPPPPPTPNRIRRRLKLIAIGCAVALVLGIAGAATVSHLRSHHETAAPPTTTTGPTTTLGTLPSPAGGPLVLRGSGSTRTDPFHLDAGLVIFRVEQHGSMHFAVDLATSSGRALGRLMHTDNGAPTGATADGVASGAYVLDVTADGPWTVTIEQPDPTSGQAIPVKASGTGPGLVGPFEGGGKLRFTVHHDGGATFVIALVDGKDGTSQGLVAATYGGFDGIDVFTIDGGLHYADVDADGNWTLEVTPA